MTGVSKAVWIAMATLVAAPLDVLACPSCLAAQDSDVQMAFISATAFLTFLPLALIGGLVYWLRRRMRQLDAEEAAGVIRLPTSPPRTNRAA
ncbi:MAG: hypothetical protein WEF50_14975 [Myxococcota bacterium]